MCMLEFKENHKILIRCVHPYTVYLPIFIRGRSLFDYSSKIKMTPIRTVFIECNILSLRKKRENDRPICFGRVERRK